MKKLNISFIGNFNVNFTTECDREWSLKKLGHNVRRFQENLTTAKMLLDAMSSTDLLVYSHTHDPSYIIKGLKEVFEEYKKAGIPTTSVHLDRFAWLNRESDVGTEATWFTEYIFMADGSPEAVELYKKHNLNWYWLKPGVIQRDCYLASPDKNRFPHDIIFVGSKGYHPEYRQRPQLIEFLQRTYGKRFGHYGNDGLGVVRGHDLNTLYASAKVVVGDSCFGGRPKYWSDRVTETIGRGGFLIHPPCEGLEIEGLQIYKANDFKSLKSTIDFWVANNKDREKLRVQSHEFVKKNETYTNRSEEMLKVIFGK